MPEKRIAKVEADPTFDAYANYVRTANKRDLRQLRLNDTSSWIWHIIDQIRPEIKKKRKEANNG